MELEPSLQPTMAPYAASGSISGRGVLQDLCDRLWEKLATSDSLRESDSYSRYSAEIQISLQLTDFDTTKVEERIAVGTPDPAQPSQRIALHVDASAEEIALGAVSGGVNLERPVVADEDVGEEVQAPKKRQYISRIRGG